MNFDSLLGLPFLFRDCHFHIVSALHFNISKFKISLRICLYTATLSPQNSNLKNFFITLSMILLCNFDANKAIYFLLASEAVARKCSVKKVFIEILQILQSLQGNTCAGGCFKQKNRSQASNVIKMRLQHKRFPLRNFEKFSLRSANSSF